MSKISIIVPVYKVEAFLPACLNSLLAQTFKNWEAICVDDGSPDRSGAILAEYARRDGRIHAIVQENKGVSAARNKAMSEAKGEYVCFLDSDDELAPGFLGKMLRAMEDSRADVALCDFRDGAEKQDRRNGDVPVEVYSDVFARFLSEKRRKDGHVWGNLYRKALLDGLLFPVETGIGEDLVFLYQALWRASKAVCVPEPLYFYRKRQGSAINSGLSEKVVLGNIKTGEFLADCFRNKSLSPQVRKILDRKIAKRIFKFAVLEPRRKDRRHLALWYAQTRPLLSELKRKGIYRPQCLDLKNRIKSWAFLKGC